MTKSKRAQPRDLSPVVEWGGVHTNRLEFETSATIFGQGDSAATIMYLETGRVRLSVISHAGKEAVIALLDPGHFFGEGCLAGQTLRMATAIAMEPCSVLTIDKPEMVQQLRARPDFAGQSLTHMLTRNIRIEEDLIDQLFNSTEKRLRARSSCWRDMVSPKSRTARSRGCRRNCSPRWSARRGRASTSS